MAKRVILISDITGEDIPEDESITIIVREHPSTDEPVKLDAGKSDLASLRKNKRDYAILEVVDADGETERLIVLASDFNKFIKGDADEVLAEADVVVIPAQAHAAPKPTTDAVKLDYKTLQYAGRPHRGKTTDEEKQMVQDNLETINANLKAAGIRQIELSNADHVERYGLQELAQEAGATLG